MMKKVLYFLTTCFAIIGLQAQVGINTVEPKTTLDVVGDPTDTAKLDGIIPPRITGDQLSAKTYTNTESGAFVYVTSADSTPSGQTINVTSPGLYYFDGNVWGGVVNKQSKAAGKCVNEPFNVGSNGSDITVGDYSFQWVTNGTGSSNQYTDNQINIRRNIPGSTNFISKTIGGDNFEVGSSFTNVSNGVWVKIGDAVSVLSEDFGVILLHSNDNDIYKITASGIKQTVATSSNSDGRFCYTVEQMN